MLSSPPLLQMTQREEKQYHFRNMIRARHIDSYRQKIRKQKKSKATLDKLVQQIPHEQCEVKNWCERIMNEFSIMTSYVIPDSSIYELFRMVKIFPNAATIKLLLIVSHRISKNALRMLFQSENIMLFLNRVIIFPEKITGNQQEQINAKFVQLSIVKDCFTIISHFCQMSSRQRDIIITKDTFQAIVKAVKRFKDDLYGQFIVCLYSFTSWKMGYHEQFPKIIKNVMNLYLNPKMEQPAFLKLLAKSLSNIVKTNEPWVSSLIENNTQYNIIERTLQLYKKYIEAEKTKEVGEIIHFINIFMINYVQISNNQYFQWNQFFQVWFYILDVESHGFNDAKRDIYFLFSTIFHQSEAPDSDCSLVRILIDNYHLIEILSQKLKVQINSQIAHELSYLVKMLLIFSSKIQMEAIILESGLIGAIMESVLGNYRIFKVQSKELLLEGMIALIENSLKCSKQNLYKGILHTMYAFCERLSASFLNQVQKSLVSNEMTEYLELLDMYYRKYG